MEISQEMLDLNSRRKNEVKSLKKLSQMFDEWNRDINILMIFSFFFFGLAEKKNDILIQNLSISDDDVHWCAG